MTETVEETNAKAKRKDVFEEVATYMQNSRVFSMRNIMPDTIVKMDSSAYDELDLDMMRWKQTMLFAKKHTHLQSCWTMLTLHHMNCILMGESIIDNNHQKCNRYSLTHTKNCRLMSNVSVLTIEPQSYFTRCRLGTFESQYPLKVHMSILNQNEPQRYFTSVILDLREFRLNTDKQRSITDIKISYEKWNVLRHLNMFGSTISSQLFESISSEHAFRVFHHNICEVCACICDIIEHLFYCVSFDPYSSVIAWRDLLLPVINMIQKPKSEYDVIWSVVFILYVGTKTKIFKHGNSKMLRIITWTLCYKWHVKLHYDIWSMNFWTKIQWHILNALTDYFNKHECITFTKRLRTMIRHINSLDQSKKIKHYYETANLTADFSSRFNHVDHLSEIVDSFAMDEFLDRGLRSDIAFDRVK